MHLRKWLRVLIDRSLVLGTIDRPSLHDLVLDFCVAQHSAEELRWMHRRSRRISSGQGGGGPGGRAGGWTRAPTGKLRQADVTSSWQTTSVAPVLRLNARLAKLATVLHALPSVADGRDCPPRQALEELPGPGVATVAEATVSTALAASEEFKFFESKSNTSWSNDNK